MTDDLDIPIEMANFDLLQKQYMPLILSTMRRVESFNKFNFRLERDDLAQEAAISLFKAIKTYDASTGIYFGYYLKKCIENNLKTFARDTLPHYYEKNKEKSTKEKPVFKCVQVTVGQTDDIPLGTI